MGSEGALESADIVDLRSVELEVLDLVPRVSLQVDGFERELVVNVVFYRGDDTGLIIDLGGRGLRGSFLPAEGPVGWELSKAHHLLVLLNDLMSSALSNDVDFDLPTYGDEAEGARAIVVPPDHRCHGIGVSEEQADVPAALQGLHHDEWVNSRETTSAPAVIV